MIRRMLLQISRVVAVLIGAEREVTQIDEALKRDER